MNDTQFRLTRIRTYMWSVGGEYSGYRLRAKLVPHDGPARLVPWSQADVEGFMGRPGQVTSKLMDNRFRSVLADTANEWDIQVEYRFDRGGLADIARIERWGPVPFHCP